MWKSYTYDTCVPNTYSKNFITIWSLYIFYNIREDIDTVSIKRKRSKVRETEGSKEGRYCFVLSTLILYVNKGWQTKGWQRQPVFGSRIEKKSIKMIDTKF